MADTTPHSPPPNIWQRLVSELGISALSRSSRDAKLLCAQRTIRLFAFSAVTLILVLFLAELGASDKKIGLFMTLTLTGDVVLSMLLSMIADRLGRRMILAIGAVALIGSGLVFGLCSNFWVLLAGAIFGVISPGAGEVGPFRAIEESILAQLTPIIDRNDVFSWYTFIAILGQALGTVACGWLTEMVEVRYHRTKLQAYRVVFFGYAGLGFVKLCLTLLLSKACEAGDDKKETKKNVETAEVSPLLGNDLKDGKRKKKKWLSVPANKESIVVLAKICFLQALEAISYGLLVNSWIAYYFHRKFGIKEGSLGILFFVSYLLGALSSLAASPLSKRLGLIKTLAFASLAAAVTTAVMPLPATMYPTILLFMLRSCTNALGIRTAFISSIFLPAERTSCMGITNVVRTAGVSVGPVITGVLAGRGGFWTTFVLSGVVVAAYAIGLLALFDGRDVRAEESSTVDDAEEGNRVTAM